MGWEECMDGMGVLWRKGVASVQEVGKDKAVKKISKVMRRICNIAWYFAIMKKGEEAGDNKKGVGTRMKGYEK